MQSGNHNRLVSTLVIAVVLLVLVGDVSAQLGGGGLGSSGSTIDTDIDNMIESGNQTVGPAKALVIVIATFLLGRRLLRRFTGA